MVKNANHAMKDLGQLYATGEGPYRQTYCDPLLLLGHGSCHEPRCNVYKLPFIYFNMNKYIINGILL